MLVFVNGSVSWKVVGDVTYDEFGNPLVGVEEEHTAECYIETSSETRNAKYDDGYFNNASYSVMLDMDSAGDNFAPQTISLTHNNKGDLGSFSVKRIEYYDITKSIQVWV